MSNIVLNGLTYTGEGLINGASRFMNRALALLSGFSSLYGRVNVTGKRVETRWNLTVPVLIDDDSPCGCAGEVKFITYVTLQVKFDPKANATHRTDVYNRIVSLVSATQFESSIKDLTVVP